MHYKDTHCDDREVRLLSFERPSPDRKKNSVPLPFLKTSIEGIQKRKTGAEDAIRKIEDALYELQFTTGHEDSADARHALRKEIAALKKRHEEARKKKDAKALEDIRKQVDAAFAKRFVRTATRNFSSIDRVRGLSLQGRLASFTFEKIPVQVRLNAHIAIESLRVSGINIELERPVSSRTAETLLQNAARAIARIRRRFPKQVTRVHVKGHARFEFSIQRGKVNEVWVATTQDLLRLREGVSERSRAQLKKQRATVRSIIKTYVDQRDSLRKQLRLGRFDSLGDVDPTSLTPTQQEQLRKIREIYARVRKETKREYELERLAHTRLLEVVGERGRATGLVREELIHRSNDSFIWTYEDNHGRAIRKMEFFVNQLYRVERWEGGRKISTTRYDARERRTVERREQENITNIFNPETDTAFVRRVGPPGRTVTLLLGRGAETLGTFDHERSENTAITEAAYLKRFRAIVHTREQWMIFEEQFRDLLNRAYYRPALLREIRQVGREIFGVDTLEAAIEKQYGIAIELDASEIEGCSGDPYSVELLPACLENLQRWLRVYPMALIRRSGLRTVYIASNWRGSGVHAGGFNFGNGIIGVTRHADGTFDHELLHCADWTDGGMTNEDNDWGYARFGRHYKKLYGRSGVEAIKTGKAYGDRPPGFVSAYGRYGGIDEDQATVADSMFTNYPRVMAWARREPALMAAVRETQAFYYIHSGGRMDEQFWKDHAAGLTRQRGYWANRERLDNFQRTPALERRRVAYEREQTVRSLVERAQKNRGDVKLQKQATQEVIKLMHIYPNATRIPNTFSSMLFSLPPTVQERLYKDMAERSNQPFYYFERLQHLYSHAKGIENREQKFLELRKRMEKLEPDNPEHEESLSYFYVERAKKYNGALKHITAALREGTESTGILYYARHVYPHITVKQRKTLQQLILKRANAIAATLEKREFSGDAFDFVIKAYRDLERTDDLISVYQRQAKWTRERRSSELYHESLRQLLRAQTDSGRFDDAFKTYSILAKAFEHRPSELRRALPPLPRTYSPLVAQMYQQTYNKTQDRDISWYDREELGNYYLLGRQYERALGLYHHILTSRVTQRVDVDLLQNIAEARSHVSPKMPIRQQIDKELAEYAGFHANQKRWRFNIDIGDLSVASAAEAFRILGREKEAVALHERYITFCTGIYHKSMKEKGFQVQAERMLYRAYASYVEMFLRKGQSKCAISTYQSLLKVLNKESRLRKHIRERVSEIEKDKKGNEE